MRAVANNREAAELVGIPTTRLLAIAVGIGVALAGVSGMLIGTLFPFTVLSGDGYQLKGFIVTVLGGFGNPVGALLGRRRARAARRRGHAVRAGELDAGDRVRAVRPGADRVSRRRIRVAARSALDAAAAVLLDHRARHRRFRGGAGDRQRRRAAREPGARRRLHHARQQSQPDARLCRLHQFRQHRLLRAGRLYLRLAGQCPWLVAGREPAGRRASASACCR